MKNLKIYRDTQNNKQSKSERIRVVNTSVPHMKDAITIHIHDSNDADRVELFIYKLLSLVD